MKDKLEETYRPQAETVDGNLLSEEYKRAGPTVELSGLEAGAVGFTMFDSSQSKDNLLSVLLPREHLSALPSQSLVRIRSRSRDKGGDGRQYLGVVIEGPFAEPDGLRADSHLVVTTTIQGTVFMPQYHGRVLVQILGEEPDGEGSPLIPPRFRPLPSSPVFPLDREETRQILGLEGDINLGYAVGMEDMEVKWPSDKKSVLPRHVGVLGTTGGGKTTTIANKLYQFSKAGLAAVVIDTEGEYTNIDQPTDDVKMEAALTKQSRKPEGLPDVHVFHLVGRESTARGRVHPRPFSLQFSSLSPYIAMDILDLTPAQQDRFFLAYNVSKAVLKRLKIFPKTKEDENFLHAYDEFEGGYPGLTLSHLIDICGFFHASLTNDESFTPYNYDLKRRSNEIWQLVKARQTDSARSWRALLSKLWRIHRLHIFDNPDANNLPIDDMLVSGRTTVIDLSDTDSPILRNLAIADILRALQMAQNSAFKKAAKADKQPVPVIVVIEEAHEFLSRSRAEKMRNLFEQVSKIAKRGRKRWFGLVFVTQLPQDLPDEILGLINNYILHKIGDGNVISRLKRSIGGIDDGLWSRLPQLAPGQAVIASGKMTRPLLVTIHPAPCKLLMVE